MMPVTYVEGSGKIVICIYIVRGRENNKANIA